MVYLLGTITSAEYKYNRRHDISMIPVVPTSVECFAATVPSTEGQQMTILGTMLHFEASWKFRQAQIWLLDLDPPVFCAVSLLLFSVSERSTVCASAALAGHQVI